MAQQLLEYPPALEIKDMLHLSDDGEWRERRLRGEGLGTSWISNTTRAAVTNLFYPSTAQEGKCIVNNCTYSTLSRNKLLDHIVTHCIIYTLDCHYITSRRDSAVKYMWTCNGRKGFITQVDADSWRRLQEADFNPRIYILLLFNEFYCKPLYGC